MQLVAFPLFRVISRFINKKQQKKNIFVSIFFSLIYARMAALCQLGVNFDYFQRLLRDFRVWRRALTLSTRNCDSVQKETP